MPLTLHLRIFIWRKDGVVENIEADQSYYKIDESRVGKKSFDQHVAHVAPCDTESEILKENTNFFLSLDPDHGFM